MLFFTSLFFSGPTKESESEKLVTQLKQQIETLSQDEATNKQALEKLREDYQSLQQQLDQLKTPPGQPAPHSK